jgi:integral membrane protein
MIKYLRILGNVEGVSYLLLLGVVIYRECLGLEKVFAFGIDLVKRLGMAHGVLFMAYCILLALCMRKFKWSFGFGFYLFVATLIPFGTFVTDRKLKEISTV